MTQLLQGDAEWLAALPDPIQTELSQLTRLVMGMSRDERESALASLVGVAEAFIRAGGAVVDLPIIRLLSAVAQTIREVDVAGFPRTSEGA